MGEQAGDRVVLTEERDRVLLITINRPEARNAVNRAVAEGIAAALDRLEAADQLSIAIMAGDPIEAQYSWPEEEFWDRQAEISGPVFASEDAREGATAFAEKRKPVWNGR